MTQPPSYQPSDQQGQYLAQPQYDAQTPYQGQPGYGAYPPPAAPDKTWMNITALVTALCGIGIAGIIFGHLGMAAAKRGEADQRGMGLAGAIIGYVQAGLIVGFLVVYFLMLAFAFGIFATAASSV